jgi:hypothetical protein
MLYICIVTTPNQYNEQNDVSPNWQNEKEHLPY